jgi:putative ABC transport system permease protein
MQDWRRHVRAHLPPLDIAPEREIEIVDELAQQLEAAFDAAIAHGATPADARARALAEVPDWHDLARTLAHIERRPPPLVTGAPAGGIMSDFIRDVRYACRMLARAPGFAALAITTLALGIGATTIVYSLVDGILLTPLPIREPDRVVLAREVAPNGVEFSLAWPNFVDWKARATSFEDLAAWSGFAVNLTEIDRPRRVMARQVTWNLLAVLGVQPIMGRGFTPDDDRPDAERVCLVSYGFWRQELGGMPDALGRQITLDDRRYTVVGVLPSDFTIARQEDVWRPLGEFLAPGSALLVRGNHNGLAAIGRLAPGATVESARAELTAIAAQLEQEYPETNSGNSAAARPLFEVLVSTSRPTLRVLLGAVIAMLLIACVNLANLLLARSSARSQELAVRRALGAAGWRIARQLLTESVLIAICGGVAGALLAWAGFNLVLSLLPSDQIARVHTVSIDLRVLAVAGGISVLTGLLFGLVPALQAAGRSPSLLRTTRIAGVGGGSARTRRGLLLAEVALALMLLAGAGVMLRTMSNLLAIDTGFETAGVITGQMILPAARYAPNQRRVFYDAAVERLRTIPGVVNAALTLSLPVQGSNWGSVFIVNDQPVPPRADLPSAAFTTVTPGYHETLGIRLLGGRLFQPTDNDAAPRVVIVNETFARRFWPQGNAIGQRVKQGWPEDNAPPWREIVGVVGDVKVNGLDQPPPLQVYIPLAQTPSTFLGIVARVQENASVTPAAIEAAIHDVDRNLPVFDIRTMDEVVGRAVGQQRMTTAFLLGFAAIALIMAAVGVFGVTAYTVSQRTHEMGVRMALGATRAMVMRLVIRQELMVCAAGIVVGIAGALALASMLQSLVYNVPARDPLTLVAVSLVLFVVTLAAGYLPARRATKIDPVAALRAD